MAETKRRARNRAPSKAPIEAEDDLWSHIEPESSRRLLLASLDVFASYGFSAATTRQIAEQAGMSPAAVYMHYRSKMDLLLEISRVGHTSLLAVVTDAIEGIDDPEVALRRFMEAFAAWHARHSTLARVAQYELAALSGEDAEDIREVRDQFQDRLSALLRKGQHRHQFTVTDIRSTGRAIMSLGIDVSRWYRPDEPLSPADVGRLYGDLAVRMVVKSQDVV